MTNDHFVGVDVGTGSARAGVFRRDGTLVSTAKRDIKLWMEGPDIAEQSSEDIWQSVSASVREAMVLANLDGDAIGGSASMPRARWWFSDPTDRRYRSGFMETRTQHHRLDGPPRN